MRLTLDLPGHPILDLDERQLLGEGGEGRVFAVDTDRVVKVYHPNLPGLAARGQKLRALHGLRAVLAGTRLVLPEATCIDGHGAVVGYTMRRLDGVSELFQLLTRRPAGVSAMTLLSTYRGLLQTLRGLHGRGVVVGDLNDGNVLVDDGGRGDGWLIDTDSVQLPGLPCVVAHERTLDPRLYGTDLTKAAAFSVDSDHYALRVLLFQALCGVHPYGGVHPKLPTLVRRAEARHSVLRGDVTLPKTARSLLALPDALRADFACAFDDDVRVPLDDALLALPWVRCGCGLEHGQRKCPACAVIVAMPARRVSGSADLDVVLAAEAVVAVTFDGALRTVTLKDGALVRENGDVVLVGAPPPGLQVGIAGGRTWLALADDAWHDAGATLIALQGGVVVERTSTGLVYGRPAWCVSPVGLFRLDGDSIVHHDSGNRVGRALPGATSLFAVDDGCLAIWRAGRVFHASWCRPGHGAFDIVLPPVDGRLRILDVMASGERAVIALTLEHAGRDHHRLIVVERSRGVVASAEHDGTDDRVAFIQPARPRLLRGRRLLNVDERGLAVVALNDGAIDLQLRFDDDALDDVVKDATSLLPGPGDDLFVVSPTAITRCRRRAPTTTTTTPTTK
jgi:hypothetical protein